MNFLKSDFLSKCKIITGKSQMIARNTVSTSMRLITSDGQKVSINRNNTVRFFNPETSKEFYGLKVNNGEKVIGYNKNNKILGFVDIDNIPEGWQVIGNL